MQRSCQSPSTDYGESSELEREQEDWRLKYRSAFTYADYNDLDNMGYEAPKRYPQHVMISPLHNNIN